jgi:hypothetical protein
VAERRDEQAWLGDMPGWCQLDPTAIPDGVRERRLLAFTRFADGRHPTKKYTTNQIISYPSSYLHALLNPLSLSSLYPSIPSSLLSVLFLFLVPCHLPVCLPLSRLPVSPTVPLVVLTLRPSSVLSFSTLVLGCCLRAYGEFGWPPPLSRVLLAYARVGIAKRSESFQPQPPVPVRARAPREQPAMPPSRPVPSPRR